MRTTAAGASATSKSARPSTRVLRRTLRVPLENLHVPDPNAPDDYEALIERLGGIDVFLLASGQTDGHVAFNPQGCALSERTRVIELTQATRRDNLGTFPDFRNLAEVPRYGVSVGPGTIAHHSRAALMMLLGAAKGIALQRVTSTTTYDPDWPASVVVECADAQIVTDDARRSRAWPADPWSDRSDYDLLMSRGPVGLLGFASLVAA